jgi:hypothetical protein
MQLAVVTPRTRGPIPRGLSIRKRRCNEGFEAADARVPIPPTAGEMTFVRHYMHFTCTSNDLPQSGDMIPFEPEQRLCA